MFVIKFILVSLKSQSKQIILSATLINSFISTETSNGVVDVEANVPVDNR